MKGQDDPLTATGGSHHYGTESLPGEVHGILRMKVSDWGGDILAFLRITAGGDDQMIALSKVRMLADARSCTTVKGPRQAGV